MSKNKFISPQLFYAHKPGETDQDYQDASDFNPTRGRYAIADGATKSFFPAPWAQLLVKHFCQADDAPNQQLFEQQNWQA